MKMSKILALLLVVVMVLSVLVACGGGGTTTETPNNGGDNSGDNNGNENNEDQYYAELAGTYDITMWTSEIAGVSDQFAAQVAAFNEKYAKYGIVVNAEIEGVTEADCATQVAADVASAPDIYCFAQDQLARLVQAAALAQPNEKITGELKADNDATSISAASVAGDLYAYPLTSDNGFFMFYDKSLISEEDAESMETLLQICEEKGKTFRYPGSNGWYNAGFFFATGCDSQWITDASGKFTSIDDSYNSANGIIAMKALQKLTQSPAYNADNEKVITDAAVIISGTWAINSMKEVFGENYAATDLPSFEVDGKSYHIGSFAGCKLMGVKPQADQKRTLVLSLLAQYLTNAESQLQRYESFGWGPSNLQAKESEAVQADPALLALAEQNKYCKIQGQISGAWWDIAALLGDEAKAATSDADLQTALDKYDEAIAASLSKSDEELQAWSAIGTIKGTSWNTDFPLTAVGDNVFESEVLALTAGEEYKIRQGGSWDVNYGVGGSANGANIPVEESGNFVIRFTIVSATEVKIELIPAG